MLPFKIQGGKAIVAGIDSVVPGQGCQFLQAIHNFSTAAAGKIRAPARAEKQRVAAKNTVLCNVTHTAGGVTGRGQHGKDRVAQGDSIAVLHQNIRLCRRLREE